jgi:hypothetical protein
MTQLPANSTSSNGLFTVRGPGIEADAEANGGVIGRLGDMTILAAPKASDVASQFDAIRNGCRLGALGMG